MAPRIIGFFGSSPELAHAPKGHVTLIAEGAEGPVGYVAGTLIDRGNGAPLQLAVAAAEIAKEAQITPPLL